MEESQKRVAENQQRSESAQNPDVDTASRDIPGNGQLMKPIYAKLVSALDSLAYYDPLLVDESMSSTDKFTRYRFFQNLQLPFFAHLFQYHAGSQIGNISFIWKIPESEKDRSERGQKLAVAKAKSLAFIFNSSHEVSFHRSICLCHRTQPCCLEKHVSLSHR